MNSLFLLQSSTFSSSRLFIIPAKQNNLGSVFSPVDGKEKELCGRREPGNLNTQTLLIGLGRRIETPVPVFSVGLGSMYRKREQVPPFLAWIERAGTFGPPGKLSSSPHPRKSAKYSTLSSPSNPLNSHSVGIHD